MNLVWRNYFKSSIRGQEEKVMEVYTQRKLEYDPNKYSTYLMDPDGLLLDELNRQLGLVKAGGVVRQPDYWGCSDHVEQHDHIDPPLPPPHAVAMAAKAKGTHKHA